MIDTKIRLCYVFSRYSREPIDGKQVQFFKLLPLLAEQFGEVEVLGLARSASNLAGTRWQGPPNVEITELIFPGSYDFQAVLCLWAGHAWLPWPGLSTLRQWILERDGTDVVYFFEGFPLAGLLRWPRRGQVFWGEVDSYLRRALRFRRLGVRRGLKGWLGVRAARHLERVGLNAASGTQVYSEEDARFLRRVHKTGKIVGIPMLYESTGATHTISVARGRARVLVWADASHLHLASSIREALVAVGPAQTNREVDYVFLINENEALRTEIAGAGWEVHSRIADLDAFFAKVDFVLLPDLSGTGIKNRTLFALARGVCVLGTRIAWEGIPMTDGVHGVVLRTVSSAGAWVAALHRSSRRIEMGRAGQRLVRDFFSPTMVAGLWGKFFGAVGDASQNAVIEVGSSRVSAR